MKTIFIIISLLCLNSSVWSQSWGDSSAKRQPFFQAVETPPKFPGGIAGYYRFVADNLTVPQVASGVLFRKTVIVNIYLDKDGNIIFAQVDEGIDRHFNLAALELIRKMPAWIPGKQNNHPVPVIIPLHITFVD